MLSFGTIFTGSTVNLTLVGVGVYLGSSYEESWGSDFGHFGTIFTGSTVNLYFGRSDCDFCTGIIAVGPNICHQATLTHQGGAG